MAEGEDKIKADMVVSVHPRRAAQCVGMVAVSRMTTAHKTQPKTLAFVEQLFVLPTWRNKGIGSWLLRHVATGARFQSAINRRYAGFVNGEPTVDKVALVVRKHARQQAAARVVYKRAGLRAKRGQRVRMLYSCPVEDSTFRIEPLVERLTDKKDAVETYMDADADTVLQSIEENPIKPMGGPKRIHIRSEAMPSDEFVTTHSAFMQRLRTCHDPRNGGDGDNADELVKTAEYVIAVYAWTPPPQASMRLPSFVARR